jgi:hypothetical protein
MKNLCGWMIKSVHIPWAVVMGMCRARQARPSDVARANGMANQHSPPSR